jgi:hypothetical protein
MRIFAREKHWIKVRRGAHLLVSNLCALSHGGSAIDRDVLAYYAIAPQQVKANDRLVLHRKPKNPTSPPAAGQKVKPVLGACPPLRAYAA